MTDTQPTGSWGEEQAATFLERSGYQILHRNYRYHHAEIDLIAVKERLLIFVEVKTRRWVTFGQPEEFVTASKARLIRKAAEHYIFEQDWQHDVRFDVISIHIQGKSKYSIRHIEDAFW